MKKIRNFINTLLLCGIVAFTFSACGGGGGGGGGSGDEGDLSGGNATDSPSGGNQEEVVDYAPTSLTGKTIVYTSSRKAQTYRFGSGIYEAVDTKFEQMNSTFPHKGTYTITHRDKNCLRIRLTDNESVINHDEKEWVSWENQEWELKFYSSTEANGTNKFEIFVDYGTQSSGFTDNGSEKFSITIR